MVQGVTRDFPMAADVRPVVTKTRTTARATTFFLQCFFVYYSKELIVKLFDLTVEERLAEGIPM